MHPIIKKTFGGLSKVYFFRQFMFGLIFPLVLLMMTSAAPQKMPISFFLMLVINTLLYPYSRFVYESLMDFIIGDNQFFVNAILMLLVKFFTMMLCWGLAMFIAPLGLAYLYYLHSKISRQA